MKVFEIQGAFGLDRLTLGERPKPVPGPGQVLLRMRAMSINYRDILMVKGLYDRRQPLPLIPCSDGVGEVVEVGSGVERVQPGDRVATLFSQAWISGTPSRRRLRSTLGGPLQGTLAEWMVLSEEGVAKVPYHMTDTEAATLPCAALTAWSALVTQGDVKPGQTVLVQGTGGVSLFALQIAKLLGAQVIVTSSREDKLQRALQMGATHGIDYLETPEWGKQVRELSDGLGVDHIVEVGGAGTLPQSLHAIRPGGSISLIGVLAGHTVEFSILPILMQNIRVQGILVGHRDGFEAMVRAMAESKLVPAIDRVFPFDEAREAFAYMASGQHFGKVCIEV